MKNQISVSRTMLKLSLILVLWVFLVTHLRVVEAIGVNWGTSASHPLPPPKVVELLKSNKIKKVKLFDADPLVLKSLSGSKIDVTVGIPNSMLKTLSSSKKAAESWVHNNLTRYISSGGGGVRIEYIAVGDEPFRVSHGQQFRPFIIGAVMNIQIALVGAGLANSVKVVVPCHSDAYISESGRPSKGHFRPEINKTMIELLTFLNKHHSPFFVNIYPFSNLLQSKNTTLGFSIFEPTAHSLNDSRKTYKNSLDVSLDTLVTALSAMRFPDMEIVVGQIGWPSDGALNASSPVAQKFMKGLVNYVQGKMGTPLRPRKPPIETYIFSLLDEDQRSIATGNFERHWGVFTIDGQAKYHVDLGQGSTELVNAQDVKYLPTRWCVVNNNKDLANVTSKVLEACSAADCSAMSPGSSCFNLSWPGNVSYAFNSYYQQNAQKRNSCDFGGLGLITTVDPSVGTCRYIVGLQPSFSISLHTTLLIWRRLLIAAFVLVCLLGFS